MGKLWALATIPLVISCIVPPELPPDSCSLVTCEEGERCVDGFCVLDETIPECTLDSDCVAGWRCQDGVCTSSLIEDPCAAVTCEEGEWCVEGLCLPTGTAASCFADEDCLAGEKCDGGECVEDPDQDTALEVENPNVAFSDLYLGEAYPIVAPGPPETQEEIDGETVEVPNGDIDLGAEGAPVGEVDPLPQRPAPADCTCRWEVTPQGAADLAPIDTCTTELTPKQSGDFTLLLSVTCPDAQLDFDQQATAAVRPTPCSTNADCADSEICTEAICVNRTGPVVTVLAERSRPPFVVTFDLHLEDRTGSPIQTGVTREQYRIFEEGQEIDYTETGYSVTPAPDLPLETILVLDYTRSLANANAITDTVAAAGQFVLGEHFSATHRIGLIEFHERTAEGDGFKAVAELTVADEAGKQLLAQSIPTEGSLEPGFSRAWDAMELAIDMLTEVEPRPGERQTIVLFTDGGDTTSDALLDDIVASAQASDINVYTVGFGQVGDNETTLQSLADQTGGLYLPAAEVDSLSQAFAAIAFDLRGQWTLNYITQRNSGTIPIRVEFNWQDASDSFEAELNISSLEGDIHSMIVEVLDGDYSSATNMTSFPLRVLYTPRNISRLRFFVPQAGSIMIQDQSGGLTAAQDGWLLLSAEGTYDLLGNEPLAYGAFGDLGTVLLPGEVTQLQITHDDSIYASSVQPKKVLFEGDSRAAPAVLSIVVDPPEGGFITRSPARFAYATGETVTLTAAPYGDHIFEKWEGNASGTDPGVTVTMDGDQSVTARFYPPRTLTINVVPAGAGTVTLSPDKGTYQQGDVVTLTAVPGSGTFIAWSGDARGTGTTTTVTMSADRTVTATFTVTP